ncbi:hypothetical protein HAX54_027941, partial [Datura stramonium]|nr:hypothetical protein [Datura stramonium]
PQGKVLEELNLDLSLKKENCARILSYWLMEPLQLWECHSSKTFMTVEVLHNKKGGIAVRSAVAWSW